MAGVEVLGALASAAQIVNYAMSAAEHLRKAYERAKGMNPEFHRQYSQVKQAACTAQFIESIPSLQTPLVMEHLEHIRDCVKELDEILGRVVSQKDSKLWKRFLKEVVSGRDNSGLVSKSFAALEASKSSLMLCLLGEYGNVLVDLSQRTDADRPLFRRMDSQLKSHESARRMDSEILAEVRQVKELLAQSTQTGVGSPRVADVLHTHGIMGLMQSPTSSTITYVDSEQDFEDLTPEKHLKSSTSWDFQNSPSGGYQSCIPYVGGKDRQGCLTLNTRDCGSDVPITLHERQESGFGPNTMTARTGAHYSGVKSIDNAVQVNGTIGSSQKPDISFHHYSDITAGGNSRQINGNIHDASLIMSLLER